MHKKTSCVEEARLETLRMFGVYSSPKKTYLEYLEEKEMADSFDIKAELIKARTARREKTAIELKEKLEKKLSQKEKVEKKIKV